MNNYKKFFLIALAAGLGFRVFLLWLVGAEPGLLSHSDQSKYIRLADLLLSGGGFGKEFGSQRVPLYPIFLAGCFQFAQWLGANKLIFSVVVQNLAGLAVIPVIYRMGRLFSRDAAWLAAGFAALNLNMAVYSTHILTEALFFPVFALGLLLMLQDRETRGSAHLLAAAAVLGLCTLIRPVTMYMPVFLVPYLLLERATPGFWRRAARAAAFGMIFILAFSPWLARNHALYGHAGLTSQGVQHITGWIMPAVMRHEEGISLSTAMKRSIAMWKEEAGTLPAEIRSNPFSMDKAAKEFGKDYLLQASPVSVAKAWFWGSVRNIFAPVAVELAYLLDMEWDHFYETPGEGALEQGYNFLFHNSNRVYSFMLLSGIVLTLAFRAVQTAGVWACWRRRPGVLVFFAVVVAYFLAVSGPVGYAKYRLPYEPVFVLLTALAVEWAAHRFRGRPRGRDNDQAG